LSVGENSALSVWPISHINHRACLTNILVDGLLAHHCGIVLSEFPGEKFTSDLLMRLHEEDTNYVDDATV
jgi:hypothetical protein